MDDLQIRKHLSDLTVVIFSRNRLGYLQGVVQYWSHWPVTLIILDGSDEPVDRSLFELRSAKLIWFSAVSINERFRFAAHSIETPYCCLHSDDDFLLARGAAQAIAWMRANDEITCVASDVWLFNSGHSAEAIVTGRSVLSAKPEERLVQHFSDYRFSYFYGINRSRQLQIALSAVMDATECPDFVNYPNEAAGYELGLEICCAALGKLINSPEVLLLKRVGNEHRHSDKQGSNEWLVDAKAQFSIDAWRSTLSQHLAPCLNVDELTVNDWIKEALRLFCEREIEKGYERPKFFRMVSVVAGSLKPKSNAPINGSRRLRLAHSSTHYSYRFLRYFFRTLMRTLAQSRLPVFSISRLDRADPRDLQDVMAILNGGFDR